MALIQSGRPALLDYANYEKIVALHNNFDKSKEVAVTKDQM